MFRTLMLLSARNTTRKRARTLFTAGMVVAGVALLLVGLSWIHGIFGGMLGDATAASGHVRLVHPQFAAKEELLPLYENIPDAAPLLTTLRGRPGVAAVEPRIITGVTVTVGEEIGEVFALALGAELPYFRDRVHAVDKLAQGRWWREGADELVLGQHVAHELGAKLGDEVLLLGMTQYGSMSPVKGTLVGITQGGNAFMDRQVMLPLAKAQWLTDIPNGATEVLVFADHYALGHALAVQLRALPALSALTVQAWDEREPLAGMLKTIGSVRGTLIALIVFLAALGIWNTMMMSVLERSHEIGVLRALGMSRLGVVALFVGEALAIAVVGGLVGVGLGSLPSYYLETRGVSLGANVVANMSADFPLQEVVHADLSSGNAVLALGLGLLMALVGSLIPALRASSIQPVTAMRSGR